MAETKQVKIQSMLNTRGPFDLDEFGVLIQFFIMQNIAKHKLLLSEFQDLVNRNPTFAKFTSSLYYDK